MRKKSTGGENFAHAVDGTIMQYCSVAMSCIISWFIYIVCYTLNNGIIGSRKSRNGAPILTVDRSKGRTIFSPSPSYSPMTLRHTTSELSLCIVITIVQLIAFVQPRTIFALYHQFTEGITCTVLNISYLRYFVFISYMPHYMYQSPVDAEASILYYYKVNSPYL